MRIGYLSLRRIATRDAFRNSTSISFHLIVYSMNRVCLILFLLGMLLPSVSPAQSLSDRVAERLRTRIEAAGVGLQALNADGEAIAARSATTAFYVERGFAPLWTSSRGPGASVDRLLQAIERADRMGLHPGDYHAAAIRALVHEARSASAGDEAQARRLAELELLCTDAFLRYATHRLRGRLDPAVIEPDWTAPQRTADVADAMTRAVQSGQIERALAQLDPPQADYRTLRAALARYRRIAEDGGWPTVSDGPTLRPGVRDARVTALRERLRSTGDWSGPVRADSVAQHFDSTLVASVRHFQERHGLDADGIVGAQTLEALNVPARERVEQLRLNLERWRWLPQDLGARHIIVNIAGFELKVIENGTDVMQMRVITGQRYRRTPVFSGQISYLVLSPYWHVPNSIATKDKLPLLKKDASALTAQGYEIFRGWGADAQPIDPTTVDWSSVSARNFPYRMRQKPGPNNALGRVKFMFPNAHNVYLHDTPSRELFARAERSFSSGCIRVQQPMALAAYLLADQPEWTAERMQRVVDRQQETSVRLKAAVPVHLLYWTAWAEDDGTIHFRRDIYGRDALVAEALDAPLDERATR